MTSIDDFKKLQREYSYLEQNRKVIVLQCMFSDDKIIFISCCLVAVVISFFQE